MRILFEMLFLVFALLSAPAIAWSAADADSNWWYVQVGTYDHYHDKDDYEGPPLFAGIEYHVDDKTYFGFSVFINSFGDFSEYAYVGKAFHPWHKQPAFRLLLTGGIAHGYEGKHHDVLPIRWGDSWGIGIVPAIGYKRNRVGIDLALLGESGLLLLVGCEF